MNGRERGHFIQPENAVREAHLRVSIRKVAAAIEFERDERA